MGPFAGDLKRTSAFSNPPPFTGTWHAALTADGVEDAWLLVEWGTANPG
ncbi:hypothetical protein [Nonomuraea fuscirosea]